MYWQGRTKKKDIEIDFINQVSRAIWVAKGRLPKVCQLIIPRILEPIPDRALSKRFGLN